MKRILSDLACIGTSAPSNPFVGFACTRAAAMKSNQSVEQTADYIPCSYAYIEVAKMMAAAIALLPFPVMMQTKVVPRDTSEMQNHTISLPSAGV